jgi:hypothetical protein
MSHAMRRCEREAKIDMRMLSSTRTGWRGERPKVSSARFAFELFAQAGELLFALGLRSIGIKRDGTFQNRL